MSLSVPESPADDTSDRQLQFAENLFKEGDYYRAITEYKRFMFYFPGDARLEKASFRIGESYYRAKRWTEAIDAFTEFITRYPKSSMVNDALWLKGLSEKKSKHYDDALSTFVLLANRDTGDWRSKAFYESALLYIDREEWGKAKDAFVRIPGDSYLFPSAKLIASGLERMSDLPLKSPAVAGGLAAVLPGAGHLYVERPRDALVAFLLNGTFIIAAVELFRHDEYVAGGIVTFFEVGWYTGNIYSAVNSAHKYNKNVQDEFIRQMREKNEISIGKREATRLSYSMYNISF